MREEEEIYLNRRRFFTRLGAHKEEIKKEIDLYPYSTQGNLTHLDNLLREINLVAEDVLVSETVNDIGGADGDMAFYSEFLGARRTNLIEHAPTNFNHLMAATRLKENLGSRVNIFDIDLNDPSGWQKIEEVETTIFLGTLYHLQNPFLALSQLSKKSKHLLLSTRVFDEVNSEVIGPASCAYFYHAGECNQDSTNWWCFTDECLKRMISRSGWTIVAYKRVGCGMSADPVDGQKDGRAFAYLSSREKTEALLA